MDEADIIRYLKEAPFFCALTEQELALFATYITVKQYTHGKQLFLQGDEPAQFYVIARGWIKLFRETIDGKESVINLLTNGDSIGDEVISEPSVQPYSAEVVSDITLLTLPLNIIREKLEQDGKLALKMLGALAKHMSLVETQLEQMMVMTAPKRIGCFMLKLTRGQEAGSAEVTLPYDKSLIAAKLGMQAETFSRSVKTLEKTGVHVKESHVTIEDIKHLREYVCHTCSHPAECDEEKAKECHRLFGLNPKQDG